jgi:hypothetical protein
MTPLAQQPCRHEPVAAVVARTAGNRHVRVRTAQIRGCLRHRPASGFHQRQTCGSGGDGEAVGTPHLFSGQQLKTGQSRPHAVAE